MIRLMSVLAMTAAFAASVCYAATNNVDLVSAARKQIGVTVRYVPDYQRIAYPNGDAPRPAKMFFEEIEVDGCRIRRFKRV